MRRGEIWWGELPVPDGSEAGYARPVLIMQDDILTRTLQTVIAIPLTSNLDHVDSPTNVLIPHRTSKLPKDSVAVTPHVVTLPKHRLRERVCQLPDSLLADVEAALLISLGMAP